MNYLISWNQFITQIMLIILLFHTRDNISNDQVFAKGLHNKKMIERKYILYIRLDMSYSINNSFIVILYKDDLKILISVETLFVWLETHLNNQVRI